MIIKVYRKLTQNEIAYLTEFGFSVREEGNSFYIIFPNTFEVIDMEEIDNEIVYIVGRAIKDKDALLVVAKRDPALGDEISIKKESEILKNMLSELFS
jgi:hypothetical protein